MPYSAVILRCVDPITSILRLSICVLGLTYYGSFAYNYGNTVLDEFDINRVLSAI